MADNTDLNGNVIDANQSTLSSSNPFLPFSLDDLMSSLNIGSMTKAITNNLYGINHRQVNTAVPSNVDRYGYTFFTRPQLNLQSDNIRNVRNFYPLLSAVPTSLQRFIRTTLDPRLITGYNFNVGPKTLYSAAPIACPLVDNANPFIAVLSNNLSSISGWPDIVAPVFTSKNGLYNQTTSLVDGTAKYFQSFNLDATFRNTRGDPIVYLFYTWILYSALVFEGYMVPYFDFLTENEIDYNTRIYRLVMDQTNTIVTKIACTGASFPISVPTGSFFDFNNERPFNDQNKDITIRFQCDGVRYQDDIVIYDFNKSVTIFNPYMQDGYRDQYMTKVEKSLLPLFNNRGYPRISTDTYELEWYVSNDLFNSRVNNFLGVGLITQDQAANQQLQLANQDTIYTGD